MSRTLVDRKILNKLWLFLNEEHIKIQFIIFLIRLRNTFGVTI